MGTKMGACRSCYRAKWNLRIGLPPCAGGVRVLPPPPRWILRGAPALHPRRQGRRQPVCAGVAPPPSLLQHLLHLLLHPTTPSTSIEFDLGQRACSCAPACRELDYEKLVSSTRLHGRDGEGSLRVEVSPFWGLFRLLILRSTSCL